ncbi:hypothetical protein [Ruegeria atlantica]|uniref:hypothetical protein n=1 Tax=Ruegeria atlantica TaxID=81569 RepID=UPI00147E2622|nr:hypothetical protein [Ruegeria atlantica]
MSKSRCLKTSAAEQAAPFLFAQERVVILMNRAESGISLRVQRSIDKPEKADTKQYSSSLGIPSGLWFSQLVLATTNA